MYIKTKSKIELALLVNMNIFNYKLYWVIDFKVIRKVRKTQEQNFGFLFVSCDLIWHGIYMSTQGYLCYGIANGDITKFTLQLEVIWGFFFFFFFFGRFDFIHMSTQEYLCCGIAKGVTNKICSSTQDDLNFFLSLVFWPHLYVYSRVLMG